MGTLAIGLKPVRFQKPYRFIKITTKGKAIITN